MKNGKKYNKVSSDEDDKEKENEEDSFWKWLFRKPLSKLPFLIFVIGLIGVPAIAIFHFMDEDTSFIICATYIVLNMYGFKHFYTLLGLKEQVDHFTKLNKNFTKENALVKLEVDALEEANDVLRSSQNRIREANKRNRQNLSQFRELQETMAAFQATSIDELNKIKQKANKIGDSWQSNLIEHERDMLHTVFDRFEEASGKKGMTRSEFEEFSKTLPDSYRLRFKRLGTFEKISKDGKTITFEDFDAALDIFAEMEATDCDIDFTIERDDNDNDDNKEFDLSVIDDNDEDDPDDFDHARSMSYIKRWKTKRKRKYRDKKKKKIVVHSRKLRTTITREFTSELGFATKDEDESDSASGSPIPRDNDDSSSEELSFGDWGRKDVIDRKDTNDMLAAARIDSEISLLLDRDDR